MAVRRIAIPLNTANMGTSLSFSRGTIAVDWIEYGQPRFSVICFIPIYI